MKIQILNLPSIGVPKFAVVFSEVGDCDVHEFVSSTLSLREQLGAESVLVFRDQVEVPDA